MVKLMSEDDLRPVITSRPPRYRLAMWLVIGEFIFDRMVTRWSFLYGATSSPEYDLFQLGLGLVRMVLFLYYAFVTIDILHRFDNYRKADTWIWLAAATSIATYGSLITILSMKEFIPFSIPLGPVLYSFRAVGWVVSAGVIWSLRENSPGGLMGLCWAYRWAKGILVMIGMINFGLSLIGGVAPINLMVFFAYVYWIWPVILALLFYRASRAPLLEPAS